MATLADIAAALNLNKTTVSKALNDSSDISRATKQRVLEEAERVGYTKHKRKKVPVERRNLVGIICPEIVSGYYARIATHLQAHLRKKGFQALLALSAFSPELEKEQLAFLTQLNPSGIIVVTEQRDISNSIHDIPGAQSIPTVVMGLNYASREYDVVSVDETYGIRALVEHRQAGPPAHRLHWRRAGAKPLARAAAGVGPEGYRPARGICRHSRCAQRALRL